MFGVCFWSFYKMTDWVQNPFLVICCNIAPGGSTYLAVAGDCRYHIFCGQWSCTFSNWTVYTEVEAGPIFSGQWIQYLFFRKISVILLARTADYSTEPFPDKCRYSRTCTLSGFSGHVRYPSSLAKLTQFLTSAISLAIWQINSKIVAIGLCHSTITLILVLTSILVC